MKRHTQATHKFLTSKAKNKYDRVIRRTEYQTTHRCITCKLIHRILTQAGWNRMLSKAWNMGKKALIDAVYQPNPLFQMLKS